MGFLRGLAVGAVICVLQLGCETACAQAAKSAPSRSPFQARIEEVARSLKDNPRLRNLSERQRIERVEFVIGNTLFVLLHELGHVLITEMKLPVLGRAEDAADTFAALRLLTIGTSFTERVLRVASQGWFLNGRRDQQTGAEPLYFGEHSLNEQRAYQIVCLTVGSDPAKFKSLADETRMPESRQESCKEDYATASSSWDMVLKDHRRAPDQPQTRIDVIYKDGEGRLAVFARTFRTVRLLETVAQRSAADFAWPTPFTLEMRSCDAPEAAWDDKSHILWMCYNLAFDFAELYRAYVFDAPAQISTSQKSKRKKK